MSSLSRLELQIRLSKRRLAEAELLERKRQEQNAKSTTTDETPKLRASNEESHKVVSFPEEIRKHIASPPTNTVKANSYSSVGGSARSVLSTNKRTRCWESPKSTRTKSIDSKWCVNDRDNVPEKPSQRSSQKPRLSLDDSSDDNSDHLVKKPSRSFLAPKPRRSLGDSSQENESTPAFLSAGRPPPFPADDSDSDDSTLRARRLLRKQVTQQPQKSAKSPGTKQKQVSPPQSTKPKEKVVDDSVEESETDESAREDEPPVRHQNQKTGGSVKGLASYFEKGDSSCSSGKDNDDAYNWETRRSTVALNPIALEKLKDEQFKASLANLPPPPIHKQNDELWDSDPEIESKEDHTRGSSKKKGSKRKISTVSSKPMLRAGRAFEGFWDDNNVLNSRGHLLSEYSQQQLAEQPHPDGLTNLVFENMASTPFVLEHGDHRYEVPASLSRYLADFQQEGIEFMFSCLVQNMGCILADDMGLGKTLQVLTLLSALFRKSGTGLDVLKMKHRQDLVKAVAEEQKRREREALMRGMLEQPLMNINLNGERVREFGLPERWWPVMIAVPPSVLTNWEQEIDKWTNLSVAVYSDPNTREKAISQITSGMAEVMLIKNSCFTVKERFRALREIPVKWRLIIFDEFHTFKNKDATAVANIRELKNLNHSLIVGMSGTVMQNNHQELWNLVDLVETNFLGDWNEFKYEVADPIKLGRTKSASQELISISNGKANALQKKLRRIMIERKKELVLKDFLPSKREKVVMCELSSMQRTVYEQILNLPEIDYVRKANSPCDCAVNRSFFQHLNRLKHQSERVAYVREHQDNVVKRQDCCYQVPLNPHFVEGGTEPRIHPDAVIWRSMKGHAGDEPCDGCPSCCGFPVMAKLYKLANHLALLQARKTSHADVEGHPDNIDYKKALAFARVALPGVAAKLSGGYTLKDGIMDDHHALSGKLKVVDKLLAKFWIENAKVLLFSNSTKTLDLVENYLKAYGQYVYLRMDGSTDSRHRQGLADEFNNNRTNFIFLLSTKAMGVGLNLTAASKVIIFDVEWNPSNDEQAQDRAYRIGQKQDVEVYRLVAQGTIDEMKYMRQLYKGQLKQETFAEKSSEPQAARIFKGVEGDRHRKGELFGYENLFRFKDGSFLNDIWKASGKKVSTRRSDELVIHDASTISDALLGIEDSKLSEVLEKFSSAGQIRSPKAVAMVDDVKPAENDGDEGGGVYRHAYDDRFNEKEDEGDVEGFDHGDFFRDDRGGAAIEEGDEGYEEEMGGQTQNVFEIFERGGVLGDENPQDGSADFGESGRDDNEVVAVPEVPLPLGNEDSASDEDVSESEAMINPALNVPSVQRQDAKQDDTTSIWEFQEVEWVEEAHAPEHENQGTGDTADLKKANRTKILPIQGEEIARSVIQVDSPSSSQQHPLIAPIVNLFGVSSCNQKGTATDFSTSDLFLPTYKKKSKKKKK